MAEVPFTPRKNRVRVTYGTPRNRPPNSSTRLNTPEPSSSDGQPSESSAVSERDSPHMSSKLLETPQRSGSEEEEDGEPSAKRRLVQASLAFAARPRLRPLPKPKHTRHRTAECASDAGQRPKTQTFLDFGQRPIAPSPCTDCGMAFQRGRDEDERLHKTYHRAWQQRQARLLVWDIDYAQANDPGFEPVEYPAKLASNGNPKEGSLSSMAAVRIVDAHGSSRREIQRALEILNHANEQLGACTLSLADLALGQRKIFLYISPRGRVDGCILAELITGARRVAVGVDGAAGVSCEADMVPAVCGISRVWVAAHARRSGIASQLLRVVQRRFAYGYHVDIDQIAFTQPTADGRALAERIFKRKDFLVYTET
ncbi:hypothetical protein H4S02_004590 [Coemansia sp. RSA 2611]|nr:hypothetical protein H4S02_004590 [Coemansia sp. RSA 2611]